MTIESQNRIAGPFSGTGIQTDFPFNFKVFQGSDVAVVVDSGLPSETTLVLSSTYSVTLNQNQDVQPGGVVRLFDPLQAGYTMIITSSVPMLQRVQLTNQGGFYPTVINGALDRQTIISQQLKARLDRTLEFPLTDGQLPGQLPTASVRANSLLGFDSDGRIVTTVPNSESATAVGLALGSLISNLFGGTWGALVGYIHSATGAVRRDLLDRLRERLSVKDFGAVGNETADDTTAFETAFGTAGRHLYIPPGKYRLTRIISLASNTTVECDGEIIWDGTAEKGSVFLGIRKTDIFMHRLNVRNDGPNDNFLALDLRRCANVYLFRPRTRGCSVVQTIPLKDDGGFCAYADVIPDVTNAGFNCSRDIRVWDMDCVGRGATKGVAACNFFYPVDWSVIGGSADQIKFGVQWWGGDSNHTVDGAVANDRKCLNGKVIGVSATNGLAGIWGSMGRNIQVTSCYTAYHDDVGIDPEGCLNVVIANNVSEHCVNGCYAGFYFNRFCSFLGNRAYQDGTHGILMFATYNASNAPIPEYEVGNNSFVYGGSGFGAVALQAGINILNYYNNYMRDTFFGTGLNNSGMMSLNSNTLHFTKVIPSGVTVVYLAANNQRFVNAHDNIVTTDVAQAGTGVTIFSSIQGDANSVVPTSFRRNQIFNFGPGTTCFRILGASPNAGVVNPFAIIDNIYDGAIVNDSAPGRSIEYFASNRKTSGAPV